MPLIIDELVAEVQAEPNPAQASATEARPPAGPPGDTLLAYTDGVTDAIAIDESFYGEARLQSELSGVALDATAAEWVDATMRSVFHFAEGHAQADDITVLALRILPPGA